MNWEELMSHLDEAFKSEENKIKLESFLKDKKFILDDKNKYIEKHVFNTQREELKNYKAQIESYKAELEKTSQLITEEEHKKTLLQTQQEFNQKLEENKLRYEKELENSNKTNFLINLFSSNGSTNPQFMVKNVDLEEVTIKDGKILNGNEILENMKKNVPGLFNNMQPSIPSAGGAGQQTTKESLVKKYDECLATGNITGAMGIMTQIKGLEK